MTEINDQNTVSDAERGVGIQKIYLKDCSFESPESPKIFAMDKWEPKLNLQVDTMVRPGADDRFEVILKITVEAKQNDQVAFLCEVQQAGVFVLKGFEAEAERQLLGVFCPGTLFPYAREQVSNLVSKGGFPALMLQPLNFDSMYEQQREQAAAG
jgi:preprotein translocase subunit SecB